ncbi:hypothetical protein [Spirillospora sp. CA-128828]|uniref:hypothetical protein n=1 Tax=Spirillospora sp. CA-128828 TaxID=3240033 RepID=UPI003D8B5EA3
MKVSGDQVAAVRAMLARDTEAHQRISERLDLASELAHGLLITAAFFLAAERRFTGRAASDITTFVADLRTRPGLSEIVNARIAERLLLATFTDEEINDISGEGQADHFGVLLVGLTVDFSDAELDGLLNGARELADEWLSAD